TTLHAFPTRRSADLATGAQPSTRQASHDLRCMIGVGDRWLDVGAAYPSPAAPDRKGQERIKTRTIRVYNPARSAVVAGAMDGGVTHVPWFPGPPMVGCSAGAGCQRRAAGLRRQR